MKTRIKKVFMENGAVRYYPQIKFSFFWITLRDPFGWEYKDTLEQAQGVLKEQLNAIKGQTPVRHSIIQYP